MAPTPPAASSSPAAAFPSTLWSEVIALQNVDPEKHRERLARLIERYWKPVYWAVRSYSGLVKEEAADLTQEFFSRILDGQVISTADPAKGSFRAYLKGALHHFLLDEWKRGRAKKRGGDRKILSWNVEDAGPEPPSLGSDPGTALDRAWAIQLLEEAVETLVAEMAAKGRAREMEIFRRFELSPAGPRPSYSELGAEHGLGPLEVQNALRFCRRKLRAILMEKVGTYVRNEAELFDELRELFGG